MRAIESAWIDRLAAKDFKRDDGRARTFHGQHLHRTLVALDQVRRSASECLRRRSRGPGRHRFLDDLLQFPPPSSGHEQPDADGRMARRAWIGSRRRRDLWICRFAWTTQTRCPHTHSRAETTKGSGLKGFRRGRKKQEQAAIHLNSNGPWSHERGPLHKASTPEFFRIWRG